jgi:hypothetical protein
MTIRKLRLKLNVVMSMKEEHVIISLELARSWVMLSRESPSGDSRR